MDRIKVAESFHSESLLKNVALHHMTGFLHFWGWVGNVRLPGGRPHMTEGTPLVL